MSSDVPDVELESFVVDFLDVEANGGYRCNSLVEFHLVEDGGFACVVESKHEYLGLHVGEGVEEFVDELSHESMNDNESD